VCTILRPKISRRLGLLAAASTLLVGGGCGARAVPASSVVVADPASLPGLASAPRRPDGVVVEPPPAIPRASDRAPARGVVTLREPLGVEAAQDLVRAYVHAFEHEDEGALAQLLTSDAAPLFGGRGGRGALLEQWRTRLKNLDYGKLAGLEVARLERMERFEYDELGAPAPLQRPPEMKPGELLLRIPIATPRVGAEQLFGDVVVLLLRREEGHFKIAGASEDSSP
jgi:hypothetical protein